MSEIYKRTPMPKCDFNKVAEQLYWNHFSVWVFSCKFAAYFQNTFSYEHLWVAASEISIKTGIFYSLNFCCSGIIDLKKKLGKNKNKLRTIYPKNHEKFKNSKPNFTGSYKKVYFSLYIHYKWSYNLIKTATLLSIVQPQGIA